jgi:hypothetical protein
MRQNARHHAAGYQQKRLQKADPDTVRDRNDEHEAE